MVSALFTSALAVAASTSLVLAAPAAAAVSQVIRDTCGSSQFPSRFLLQAYDGDFDFLEVVGGIVYFGATGATNPPLSSNFYINTTSSRAGVTGLPQLSYIDENGQEYGVYATDSVDGILTSYAYGAQVPSAVLPVTASICTPSNQVTLDLFEVKTSTYLQTCPDDDDEVRLSTSLQSGCSAISSLVAVNDAY
jgi:hypothetical protein